MPVLDIDGVVLAQSDAISKYLATEFGKSFHSARAKILFGFELEPVAFRVNVELWMGS